MHLIVTGWIYIVFMMAIVEATSSSGSILGALFTLLLYGLLPISIVMYLLGTPARRRKQRAKEETASLSAPPDSSHMTPCDTITPERKEH